MLSDRSARLKVLAALALLLALGLRYAYESSTQMSYYARMERRGERADGKTVRLPIWTVTAIDGPDRFEISKVVRDIPVEAPTADLTVGQTVSVVGRYRAADGVVVADIVAHHPYRRLKEGLGIAGVLLSILAFPFGFRVAKGGLVERA